MLYTWVYYILTLVGFLVLSHLQGESFIVGLITCLVISVPGHSIWRSRVSAFVLKKLFTKSFLGFAVDLFRTRSLSSATKEMINVGPFDKDELSIYTQKESRWLVIIPVLYVPVAVVLDYLLPMPQGYFTIAASYFLLVGWTWMRLCRQGWLCILPVDTE